MNLGKILLLLILFIFVMYFGQFILLPLSLALFVFIIVKSLSAKLLYYTKKYLKFQLGELISILLMFFIIIVLSYLISVIFKFNILHVIDNSSSYQKNLEKIFEFSSIQHISELVPIEKFINSLNFVNFLSKLLNGFTNFAGRLFVCLLN